MRRNARNRYDGGQGDQYRVLAYGENVGCIEAEYIIKQMRKKRSEHDDGAGPQQINGSYDRCHIGKYARNLPEAQIAIRKDRENAGSFLEKKGFANPVLSVCHEDRLAAAQDTLYFFAAKRFVLSGSLAPDLQLYSHYQKRAAQGLRPEHCGQIAMIHIALEEGRGRLRCLAHFPGCLKIHTSFEGTGKG